MSGGEETDSFMAERDASAHHMIHASEIIAGDKRCVNSIRFEIDEHERDLSGNYLFKNILVYLYGGGVHD